MTQIRWGTVSTIKAPMRDILNFASHHLELGAHRLYIYLDDDNQQAYKALKQHPKIRVTLTDDIYWKRLGMARRKRHQSRQFENARNAYAKRPEVDWLAHIDVDEFIAPDAKVDQILAKLPTECLCARMPPIESLAPLDGSENAPLYLKARAQNRNRRERDTIAVFPTYGNVLNGGFLSHVAGKMFYRTAVPDLRVQIHNVFVGEEMNPGETVLSELELLHLHAKDWDDFSAAYAYRLQHGSYRAELSPNMSNDGGGMNMHALFKMLEAEGGMTALRAFYDEVCVANSDLKDRLAQRGLLRSHQLHLDRLRERHFPDFC